MLYDPKWEKTTKADPHSLQSMIAWLERQPAGKAYNYTCNGHCLLAQYYTAMGYERVQMGSFTLDHAGGSFCVSKNFHDIAIGDCIRFPESQWLLTFGDALYRARKIAANC